MYFIDFFNKFSFNNYVKNYHLSSQLLILLLYHENLLLLLKLYYIKLNYLI